MEIEKLQKVYDDLTKEDKGMMTFALGQAFHHSRLAELKEWSKETAEKAALFAISISPFAARSWMEHGKEEVGLILNRTGRLRTISLINAIKRKLKDLPS